MTSALRQSLALKSFPAIPDDWCESTLYPSEGGWSAVSPSANVELIAPFTGAAVGQKCVRLFANIPVYTEEARFTLNSGREFDGSADQAQLHFWIQLETGKFYPNIDVYILDASGRRARKLAGITVQVGSWVKLDLNLGSGQGWTEDAYFDWRFIKAVQTVASTTSDFWGQHMYGSVFIDEMYFTYYELEYALLTVLSEPSGIQFRYDSSIRTTPYTIGLPPSVDVTIWTNPTNFVRWEDDSTSPTRVVRLAEAEQKTITAYYSSLPPNGDGEPKQSSMPIFVAIGIAIIAGTIIIIRRVKAKK